MDSLIIDNSSRNIILPFPSPATNLMLSFSTTIQNVTFEMEGLPNYIHLTPIADFIVCPSIISGMSIVSKRLVSDTDMLAISELDMMELNEIDSFTTVV